MSTVSTDHARHTHGAGLAAAITAGTLTPGDAGAIAAMYQTPSGHGAVFATFACGMATSRPELLDAVVAEFTNTRDVDSRSELDALRVWVESQ